jgi:hypothetical protein
LNYLQKYKNYVDIKKVEKFFLGFLKIHLSQIAQIIRQNGTYAGVLYIIEQIKDTDIESGDWKASKHILSNPKDKEKQIQEIKNAIENHTDFNNPLIWGSEPYTRRGVDVFDMPNWEKWSKDKNIVNPEDFEYAITYYISLYCYEFQVFCHWFLFLQNFKKSLDLKNSNFQ